MRLGLWLHGIGFVLSVALFVWLLAPAHQATFGAVSARVLVDVADAIGRPLVRAVWAVSGALERWIFAPMFTRLVHSVR